VPGSIMYFLSVGFHFLFMILGSMIFSIINQVHDLLNVITVRSGN